MAARQGRPKHHYLPATAETVHWGYFSKLLKPAVEINSGNSRLAFYRYSLWLIWSRAEQPAPEQDRGANPGLPLGLIFPAMLVPDTALAAPSSVGQEEASFSVPSYGD